MHKRRVVLIDTSEAVRSSYKLILESSQHFEVIGEFVNAEESMAFLKRMMPNLVIADIELQGMNGIDLTKWIRAHLLHTDVIMLTQFLDSEYVFAAFRAGALGFISKFDSYTDFMHTLSDILREGAPMSPSIARMVIKSFHRSTAFNGLTKREIEVIQLMAEGKSYTTIAEDLQIASETVKSHFRNIYKKLNVSKKSDMLALVRSQKVI
jgi:DNA-binding NarL/FixJ family response regulator